MRRKNNLAEMIMDGIGSGNNAIVDDSHRLWVAGSITSMPAISIGGSIFIGSVSASVDSVYIQSGDNIAITSMPTSITDIGSRGALTSGAETLLIEHSITTGSNFNLTGFDSTGTADGTFSLYENATLLSQYRSSASNQVIMKDFTNPIKFTTGGSVMMFVKHGELLSQGFQGAMYGYEDE